MPGVACPNMQARCPLSRQCSGPVVVYKLEGRTLVVGPNAERTVSAVPMATRGSPRRKARNAAMASAVQALGPSGCTGAAHCGGAVGSHRPSTLAWKRQAASPRNRVATSARVHAFPPFLPPPHPSLCTNLVHCAGLPLAIGDIMAYPDLANGLELERLPIWASLLGLLAANVAGLALTIAVIRSLQDASEPLTVVKVQVAMLERRPQLQSKLRELSSMIEVGQQGAWLILEEAILQLLQRQNRIAYASVTAEQLASKKRAYTLFGEMAEAEAAKANREESVVRHIGETTEEEDDDIVEARKEAAHSAGMFGGLVGGLGIGGGPPSGAKELTVVTLILATRGKVTIKEKVTDWAGLRSALKQVTGLSSDRIMAVELLWTPRHESDYLTQQQLERDYPDMVPILPQMGAGHGGHSAAAGKHHH